MYNYVRSYVCVYFFAIAEQKMRNFLVLVISSLAGMALAEEQHAPFWLAKVKVKCEDTTYNCLGAVIDDKFLLTTASCVNKCNDSVRVIKVLVSKYTTNGGKQFGKKVKVTKIIIHPQYNLSETQKIHDLALVKFKCPKFQLAKVSLNDSYTNSGSLSVINLNKTSGIYSTYEANVADRKKKCKRAYKYWDDSQQVCIVASSCSDKSESLITDVQHSVLYGFPMYASLCDNNKNTVIAAMELCKYREWITNTITKGWY